MIVAHVYWVEIATWKAFVRAESAAAAVTGGVARPKVLSDDFKRAIVREMQTIAQEMNNPNPSLERDQFIRMFMDHGMDENLANG